MNECLICLSGRAVRILPAHSDPVTSVSFNYNGNMLVSSRFSLLFSFSISHLSPCVFSFDGSVRLWDVSSGNCICTFSPQMDSNPPRIFLHPYSFKLIKPLLSVMNWLGILLRRFLCSVLGECEICHHKLFWSHNSTVGYCAKYGNRIFKRNICRFLIVILQEGFFELTLVQDHSRIVCLRISYFF